MEKKAEQGRKCGGYVTVLFSMIFLSVFAVLMSALEAVRISTVRMQAEIACAVACEAFLSQYHPQVQARYGLYLIERDGLDSLFLRQMVDSNARASDKRGVSWFDSRLESVSIEDEIHIQDEDYRYFETQIAELMTILKGSEYASSMANWLTDVSSVDVGQEKYVLTTGLKNQGTVAERKEAEQKASESGSNGGKNNSNPNSNNHVSDPRKNLTALLKNPIAALVLDGNISDAVLDTSGLSSLTSAEANVSAPRGFLNYRDVAEKVKKDDLGIGSKFVTAGNEFLVDCYIIEFLKNASLPERKSGVCFSNSYKETSGLRRTPLSGRSALEYEAEYILFGKTSDASNITNMINRLSCIRMTLNLAYLLKSPAKSAAVHSVAASLAAALMMPFLESLIYMLIMAAWSYAEALIDCRTLLSGGSVPLFKSDTTWVLSLNQLTNMTSSSINGSASSQQRSGELTYDDYLRLLLLGVSKEKKYVRLMNIIEANIRLEDSCGEFLMDNSVFGITMCADFTWNALFYSGGFSSGVYEHHVRKAAAY